MRGLSRVALRASISLSFLSLPLATLASAQSVEGFYRGKQGRFVIHSTPGGAYDGWARLV